MFGAAPSIRSLRPAGIRVEQGWACTSSTVSSPIALAVGSIWIRSLAAARAFGCCCPVWLHWSRLRSEGSDVERGEVRERLFDLGELAQCRPESLAGLPDQRGPVHDCCRISEGAGDADTDRARPAEQRTDVGTGGMALDENLASESAFSYRVGAGVIQVSIAANDSAVSEDDHAAALADASILQAGMNRI